MVLHREGGVKDGRREVDAWRDGRREEGGGLREGGRREGGR